MQHFLTHLGFRCLLLITVPALASTSFAADQAEAILGRWNTQDGKAQVEIVRQHSLYAGYIVWLKEPYYPSGDAQGMAGKPKVDRKNPDVALRARPLIGLPLVSGFHFAGTDEWTGGTIYDPENGKTYSCKMILMPNGSLKVRGYIGISLFGRTTVWTRPVSTPPAVTDKNATQNQELRLNQREH